MPGGARPTGVRFVPGAVALQRRAGLPASFGTEGIGGIGGAIRGAGGRGAEASRLAHGGGGGGPSLGGLPRGGGGGSCSVCGGGSGSFVHRRFYPEPLFWGRRGVGSSGSQFSTGPEDAKRGREQRRWGEGLTRVTTHPCPEEPSTKLSSIPSGPTYFTDLKKRGQRQGRAPTSSCPLLASLGLQFQWAVQPASTSQRDT